MAHETSKQFARRRWDSRFATRWLKGDGIDIGCGADSLAGLASFLPLMRSVRPWDLPDGDAMEMEGVADASYDFVHSSHCLEHLADPYVSLGNWIRICRPGGHVIVTIPDEDLYEQGVWPSTFNPDHKWSFSIAKAGSWSPRSVNVLDLLKAFLGEVEIIRIELLDSGFQYGQHRHDQSMGTLSESAIEFVLRKRDAAPQRLDTARPLDSAAAFSTAMRHHQAGRVTEAAALYRQILDAAPDNLACLNNLAILCGPGEAEALLRRAIDLKPDYVDAQLNLGKALLDLDRHREAARCFETVLGLRPDLAQAHQQLARAFEADGDVEAEITSRERAISALGGTAADHCRLGVLCDRAARNEDALAHFDRAVALDPGHVDAHVFRGHAHLKAGDLRRGAEGLAWIWRGIGLEDQQLVFADRDGQPRDLSGQTIVLTADSGLGDTLQFVRYAELLRARGADVTVECQPELLRLFSASPALGTAVPLGAELPRFDRRIPLHNLMGAFDTTLDTVPARMPYVAAVPAETAAWRDRLRDIPGLKVGVVWAGNPRHVHDARRSIDPSWLKGLMRVDGVTLVSLQQKGAPPGSGMLDWSEYLSDMADTAALVEALDLVIAVDSAVAHLAGALGRPVWLLNRFDTCWRWLTERADSPWYPTLRQFRQPAPGDWASVLSAVERALVELAGTRTIRRAAPRRARRA